MRRGLPGGAPGRGGPAATSATSASLRRPSPERSWPAAPPTRGAARAASRRAPAGSSATCRDAAPMREAPPSRLPPRGRRVALPPSRKTPPSTERRDRRRRRPSRTPRRSRVRRRRSTAEQPAADPVGDVAATMEDAADAASAEAAPIVEDAAEPSPTDARGGRRRGRAERAGDRVRSKTGSWRPEDDLDAGSLDIERIDTVQSAVDDIGDAMMFPDSPTASERGRGCRSSRRGTPSPRRSPRRRPSRPRRPRGDGGLRRTPGAGGTVRTGGTVGAGGTRAACRARRKHPGVGAFTFGKRDPKDKARRLARVLVSDMIMYNPERHERALASGTLEGGLRGRDREVLEGVRGAGGRGDGRAATPTGRTPSTTSWPRDSSVF